MIAATNKKQEQMRMRRDAACSENAQGFAEAGRAFAGKNAAQGILRSEEHTSELQSLMRISYAVFCLENKTEPPHQANSKYRNRTLVNSTHQRQNTTHDT